MMCDKIVKVNSAIGVQYFYSAQQAPYNPLPTQHITNTSYIYLLSHSSSTIQDLLAAKVGGGGDTQQIQLLLVFTNPNI